MSPQQTVEHDFQNVFLPEEAQSFWLKHKRLIPQASIILSCPGSSPLAHKIPPMFGQGAHVVCAFAFGGLFFLNGDISSRMMMGAEARLSFAYVMAFDTNAASHLRSLVAGRKSDAIRDLWALLKHFSGNRLNWQINPYLLENSDSLDRPEVLETIIAVETMESLDVEAFLASEKIQSHYSKSELTTIAEKRIADFHSSIAAGRLQPLPQLWKIIHVSVLYMACLQKKWPRESDADVKLKALIKFLDERVNCFPAFIIALAAHWFYGDARASILQPLQSSSPKLLKKIRNVTWDLFHWMHLPNESAVVPSPASFLVPFFLTFDQALAAAMKVCALRSLLIPFPGAFPFRVPATPLIPIINKLLENDEAFLNRHLSIEAAIRREKERITGNALSLDGLDRELEDQFVRDLERKT